MSALENVTEKFKQFGPTTWSVKNKTAIYLLMLVVSGWGFLPVRDTLPKGAVPGYRDPDHLCLYDLHG
jgi:multidrug efflux pump